MGRQEPFIRWLTTSASPASTANPDYVEGKRRPGSQEPAASHIYWSIARGPLARKTASLTYLPDEKGSLVAKAQWLFRPPGISQGAVTSATGWWDPPIYVKRLEFDAVADGGLDPLGPL